MTTTRHLDWEGSFNARDLGGLDTLDRRTTRSRAIVRADSLDELSAVGWEQVRTHGIRTIIDLRNHDERSNLTTKEREAHGITTVHLPLDNIEDKEFWTYWSSGWQFGTPLYYGPHIDRFPTSSAAVVAAIANAAPGGVVFHCAGGRDRTGLIALLVLTLVGVERDAIIADYELSQDRLSPHFYTRRGEPDQGPAIEEFLASRNTSLRAMLLETLASLDLDHWRRKGGLRDADVAALRARLLP